MPKTTLRRTGRRLVGVATIALALAFARGTSHAQPVGDAYTFVGPVGGVVLDGATIVARRALPEGVYAVTISGTVANGESATGGQVSCSLEGFSGDLLTDELPSWLALPAAAPGSDVNVSWSATTTMTIGANGRARVVCENKSTIADGKLEVFGVRLVAVRIASDRRRS